MSRGFVAPRAEEAHGALKQVRARTFLTATTSVMAASNTR
jgi:hypothetical protein